MSRKIKYIVIHCTATSQEVEPSSIARYWREKLGWKNPGYHVLIEASGESNLMQPLDKIANGVKGYNSNAIHISYIGGIDKNGRPKDTRTEEQKTALKFWINALKKQYPEAEVLGHRDFPGVKKDCPSFDVKNWLKTF